MSTAQKTILNLHVQQLDMSSPLQHGNNVNVERLLPVGLQGFWQ